jgi:hypothetical protein
MQKLPRMNSYTDVFAHREFWVQHDTAVALTLAFQNAGLIRGEPRLDSVFQADQAWL